MSKYQKIFAFVVLLAIAAVVTNVERPLNKGLDIAGGMRVTMQISPRHDSDWPSKAQDRADKMTAIRKIIENRVKGLGGVTEPIVQVQNQTASRPRLIIELPGVRDPEKALDQIKSTAALEFYYLKDVKSNRNPIANWKMDADPSSDGKAYIFTGPRGETLNSEDKEDAKQILEKVVNIDENKPILTGKDLEANAKPSINQSNKIVINLEFNREGTDKFGEFTKEHQHEYLAIFFGGKLLTAPEIQEPILNGKAEVSGFRSLAEARGIADFLNAGALPVPLTVIAKDTVEPTVGASTFNQVLHAGIIGLVLVLVFMFLYYRLPGVIADIALMLYALFVVAVFKLIHASISLAGMAALIISIGMAVDANILIFERLKEELRSGKTLRAAIDAGFNRAFTAIFDSNMCTAITSAILMWYGTPAVQSFAFTLIIGVAISMFTAITVTRTILYLLVRWEWAQKPSLFGLGTSWVAKMGWNFDVVGKRVYYFILSGILIIPGLIVLATVGLRPGIEFQSGTAIQARFAQRVEQAQVSNVVQKYARGKGYEVQLGSGEKVAYIKTPPLDEKQELSLQKELNNKFTLQNKSDQAEFESVNSVGPTISRELTTNSIVAVIIASALIVLYLTFRFAIGGLGQGLKYGVCAVLALIHDASFILGMFAILGRTLHWEVDSLFVTAILTVIGFSVHDTIVVFDRIRENLRHRLRGESFEQLANRSILQTFSRSINTTFTVILTLMALILLGGPMLRHFYVALIAGMIIGTYSSIFNATQLVIVWDNLAAKGKEPKKKAFEDKAMVSAPIANPIDRPIVGADDDSTTSVITDDDKGNATKTARIQKKKKKRF